MSNSSYLEYYNIQKPEEGAGLVAYSGQTSMSSVGQKTLDKKQEPVVEGFDFTNVGGIRNTFNAPQYDMSSSLFNFPQGHPLYVPQTLAETYSSDSRALVDMEELVMGFALIGGITVMIVGLLISKGVVGPNSGSPPPAS
jgi:hypothetical protein